MHELTDSVLGERTKRTQENSTGGGEGGEFEAGAETVRGEHPCKPDVGKIGKRPCPDDGNSRSPVVKKTWGEGVSLRE